MGVDVNLYAVGDVTARELAAAEEFIIERCGEADEFFGAWLTRGDLAYYGSPRVELGTMGRYYGPGYERGDWPTIHNQILSLRAALPMCTIHYGGDGEDDCPEATDAYLAEIWQHYLGPDGFAYRRPRAPLRA